MQLTTTQSQKIAGSAFLVTGGAGFIGSHIAECLLNAGARKVRVLDNLATGHFRNVAPFANHPGFEFTIGDIRNVEACKVACEGMDYVLHQAALEPASGAVEDPQIINEVNVSGFLNMLLAAQAAGVKRFVYAMHNTETNGSPDADNKFINELYAGVFSKSNSMETIGLRYYNVFGQRQDPRSGYAAIIPKLVTQLIRLESPRMNEPGEYVRDLIYVEDVVQANILAVLSTDPQAVNQVYDIAGEERISLHQLAACLKELLSAFDKNIAEVEIIYDGVPENNIAPGAVAEKARELLGFQPHYSLRNGLLKSISWYWAYLPQFELEAREKILHNIPSTTLTV
jgi:UDP-N-acetylglucosamine/UDP-N-acetylgalactosamine 4-epimerase